MMKGGKRPGYDIGAGSTPRVMVIFYRFHYGLSTIYERGLTVMLLILSILAGAGLMWLRRLKLPTNILSMHRTSFFRNVAMVSCMLLIVVMLSIAVPTRVNASFYHMIDDEDYTAFTWIRNNISVDYSAAVIDPWKATAFSALTGKKVIHRIWTNQDPVDDRIYGYLKSGCQDITFLRDNRVSFIYDQTQCKNCDLITVRNRVYITNPNISGSFALQGEVQNAGFEAMNGNLPGYWEQWQQNCKPEYIYPDLGRDGGVCVSINIYETEPYVPWPMATWLQNIPINSGNSYIIGGWIKTDNVEGPGGARILPQWQGPGFKRISATAFMPTLKGSNGWTYYQGDVTAPPGATICTLCCLIEGCSGTAWYDDILFKEK